MINTANNIKYDENSENIKIILDNHAHYIARDVENWPDYRAIFDGLNISGINLTGRNLADASFKNCNISDSILRGCILDNCDFSGASLRNTEMNGSKVQCAHFRFTNMDNVKATNVIFNGSTFDHCFFDMMDACGSSFIECTFDSCSARYCKFMSTNFADSNIEGNISFDDCNLVNSNIAYFIKFAPNVNIMRCTYISNGEKANSLNDITKKNIFKKIIDYINRLINRMVYRNNDCN